jgi:hypothetical protein
MAAVGGAGVSVGGKGVEAGEKGAERKAHPNETVMNTNTRKTDPIVFFMTLLL